MNELRFDADCGPDEFLARLADVRRAESVADLVVRIRRGRTGDRAALFVALYALIAARELDGRSTRVEFDDADDSRAHFARERISDLKAARKLADAFADALEQRVPTLSASVLRMARFVFEELGANIVQHSGRATTGYGLLQVRDAEQRLEIAFADRGVGFRASLQRNPELEGRVTDDAEALQIALSSRVSGTGSPRSNMGIGLALLVQFADLLGGDLWIASGSAALQRKTTAAGVRTNVLKPVAGWQGSWISFDAPLR